MNTIYPDNLNRISGLIAVLIDTVISLRETVSLSWDAQRFLQIFMTAFFGVTFFLLYFYGRSSFSGLVDYVRKVISMAIGIQLLHPDMIFVSYRARVCGSVPPLTAKLSLEYRITVYEIFFAQIIGNFTICH